MEVVFGLLFGLGFAIVSAVFASKWLKAEKQAQINRQAKEKFQEELRRFQEKAKPLWQYQGIADAAREAQAIIFQAQTEAEGLLKQAAEDVKKAEEEAATTRKESRDNASQAKVKVDGILATAYHEADKVLAIANQRAEEIAGDALDAKKNADLFEQKAKAMKNLIEGYGDEYLIASRSLLDELAEDFSHKEGGVELKKARQFTKTLVKGERAATCDYAKPNRRDTAIRFVLDAFNGKVDSALSKVKHNNYGKLTQEIKDAFALVNGNGQAFRNARIAEEYLAARMDELKWAVITQDLRREEQEEQRRIREEMREEEKSRREYEKAVKEAKKEERMIHKAMEEARKQLAGASEEQRKMYEEQIAELQSKYEEAESRNQRALSMAQQTRRGHVYVISNIGSFGEDVYKIGLTRRLEPLDRVKELGDASVPFGFDIHAMIYAEDAPSLEKELHRQFEENQVNKVNPRKEFFRVGLKAIKEVVAAKNIEAHWTLLAEAREYRESLAMAMEAPQTDNPLENSPDWTAANATPA